MGLTKFIKNKAKEAVVNYKTERAHAKEERLENRNQYEKGYHEGQFKRGVLEGSGGVAAQTKFNRGSGKTQGVTGRGAIDIFGSSMKHSDSIFGWSGGAGDIGMFGEPTPKRAVPTRVTEFNPRTGKTRVIEPIQQHEPKEESWDPWAMGSGNKKKKNEQDTFWG